jgi:hypothetical protein
MNKKSRNELFFAAAIVVLRNKFSFLFFFMQHEVGGKVRFNFFEENKSIAHIFKILFFERLSRFLSPLDLGDYVPRTLD